MAKPLTNEDELYGRIRDERLRVDPRVWDIMYRDLGDAVTAINLIVSFYLEKNCDMPPEDARRILEYTRRIRTTVQNVLDPAALIRTEGWPETTAEELSLHPVIREFFTHYIGNDTHMINLCVSLYVDPVDEQPLPVTDAAKIRGYTMSMREFLDKLRTVTRHGTGF